MRLETDSEVIGRGETLMGRVRVENLSRRPISVPRAGVWLWAVNLDDQGRHIQPQLDVVHQLELSPGEATVVEFSLTILNDTTLGPTYLSLSTGLQPAAPFSYPSVTLRVLPERRFVELGEALARVSAHDISYWTSVGGGDGVFAQLTPKPEMRPLFDSLGLELYPDGAAIYGQLIVDPQERTLADVLRAATLANIHRFRIRFAPADLPLAGKEFERMLRPFVARERHLPIPSTGGSRDELPRASQPPAPDPTGLPVADASVPGAEG